MTNLDSRTFFTGFWGVVLCEVLCRYIAPHVGAQNIPWLLLGLRVVQALVILGIVIKMEGGLQTIGLAPSTWKRGIWHGTWWCLGFALVAGLSMLAMHLSGRNPLHFFSYQHRETKALAAAYLLGAGLIGPVAEELFFRGLVFGFLRRWGVAWAILGSTAVFVLSHGAGGHIPITQAVGGLVFALSYEREKSLLVPLMIHMSGNLALAGIGYWASMAGA